MQTEAPLDGWRPASGAVLPYAPGADVLEALAAGEAAGPATARWTACRRAARSRPLSRSRLATKLRAAFPLPADRDSPRRRAAAALFADGLAVAAAVAAAAARRTRALGHGAEPCRRPTRSAARADLEAFARWCRIDVRHRPEQLDARAARAAVRAGRRRRCRARRAGPHRETGRLARLRRRRSAPAGRRHRRVTRAKRVPDDDPVSRPCRATGSGSSRMPTLALARIDAATTDLAGLRSSSSAPSTATTGSRSRCPVGYGSIAVARRASWCATRSARTS